jgi:hypothetical protein
VIGWYEKKKNRTNFAVLGFFSNFHSLHFSVGSLMIASHLERKSAKLGGFYGIYE